jgi:hypothetical protein
MSWARIYLRFFSFSAASLMIASAPACTGDPDCDPPPCPYAFLELKARGTIVVTRDGEPSRTFLARQHCSVDRMSFQASSTSDSIGLRVSCQSPDGQHLSIDVRPSFDPRTLEIGSTSWPRSEKSVQVRGWSEPSRAPSFVADGTLAVDVTEAVGNERPYPELVTEDYVRRFSVASDASPPDGSAVRVTLAIEFEQTFAHRHVDLDAVCYCL